MNRTRRLSIVTMLALASVAARAADTPPEPLREFRGMWVATVANIDWPTKPGLPDAEQKQELLKLLDKAEELGFNAILFQVRPACDALYESELEPWSEYLTGEMGKAPGYDPLAFAIEEAHARGLQLHAWLNPYRALHSGAKSEPTPDHISSTKPNAVVKYGKQLWLDPGSPEAVAHSLAVVDDLVARYDLDGVHFDDYFYPYRVKDEEGAEVAFPDDVSWKLYLDQAAAAGDEPLSRDDWRRNNVDRFVEEVSRRVKAAKPHVQFGVAPFGIWRPGHPETVTGFDAYQEIYADSRLWLTEGWVDYLSPQLYWSIDSKGQSFSELLSWWTEQNPKEREIWPGVYSSRVGPQGVSNWEAEEIVDQVVCARETPGSAGTIHFSAKALVGDWGGLGTALRNGPYAEPALPPTHPDARGQAAESVVQAHLERVDRGAPVVCFDATHRGDLAGWVVQTEGADGWRTSLLPPGESAAPTAGARVAVTAVDRLGRLSAPVVLTTTQQAALAD